MNKAKYKNLILTIFLVIFIILILSSLFYNINLNKIFETNSVENKIFFQIRIPRLLTSFFIGAGLSVVGCILQSLFLNPLCEGYTLGISSSAALGVVLVSLLNIPLNRFFGSLLGIFTSTVAIYFLILNFKKTIDISFILAGIVLNFFFQSIIILLTIFFDPYKLHYVLLWLLGSFSSLPKDYVYPVCFLILLSMIFILFYSEKLDIIVLGKEKSPSLGVNENRVKNHLIFLAVIISALSVSLVGVISFIGIFVPNFVKTFVGLKHKNWILNSAIIGGIFVSLCDILAKNLFYPIEIPISVFSGLIGSIFFIFYLLNGKTFYGNFKS